MERQRSSIVKPRSLFLLSLTISSSLLFFFLLSFWALRTPPSSAASIEAHLHFTAAIKAQTFAAAAAAAAAAPTTNLSTTGDKDSIFRRTYAKDPILTDTHHLQTKDEILGDAPVLVESLMGSNQSSSSDAGACDVSEGQWVFDESYHPLYTDSSCPFIDEGFSCESNGRSDRDYTKWRWQPSQCSIPRFDPAKALELMRGKRLVFVGDSINRNQWESMLCMLRGAVSDPGRVYEARGRRITKGRGEYSFRFIDYQCSVEYFLSHFLVREGKARVNQKRRQTLRIDTIDKGSQRWKGADILVFNTAHWWSHYKTRSGLNYYQEGDQVHPHFDVNVAYRRAIKTWASWVDRHIPPGRTQVFFRSSAPSHFSGGEWNAGGHCRESTRPLNEAHIASVPEKNQILEEIVKQMRTPVTILNITTLSGYRIDGHPSIYGKKPHNGMPSKVQDCSHWCLPGVPDTWNELLYFHLLSGQRLLSMNLSSSKESAVPADTRR